MLHVDASEVELGCFAGLSLLRIKLNAYLKAGDVVVTARGLIRGGHGGRGTQRWTTLDGAATLHDTALASDLLAADEWLPEAVG